MGAGAGGGRGGDGALGAAWRELLAGLALRALLAPAYRSTDFEVHRNWLALTSQLPLREWYFEATSPWTLDYPPLFAWFERLLAVPAARVDPEMLRVDNLGYASWSAVAFQRASVVASEAVLVSAVLTFIARHGLHRGEEPWRARLCVLVTLLSPGLIFVDHIHFQYNGFLLGVMLWSALCLEKGRDLLGGALFAVLLNLKHLFLFAAPWYFVYLLRHHCRGPTLAVAAGRLSTLGALVAGIFAASLGPFFALGQLGQLAARMFAFGRGLLHAYWAPNAWALYAFADKVLEFGCRRFGLLPPGGGRGGGANLSGGLVQVNHFSVLPDVGPALALALSVAAMAPALVKAWVHPEKESVLRTLGYINLCGFCFGFHVHEKAVLHFTLLLGLEACRGGRAALEEYFFTSIAAYYGLLPLLHEPREYPVKVALLGLHAATLLGALGEGAPGKGARRLGGGGWARRPRVLYTLGFVPVEIYCSWLHPWVWKDRLAFLPLMLTSVYAALGVLWHFLLCARREVAECRATLPAEKPPAKRA